MEGFGGDGPRSGSGASGEAKRGGHKRKLVLAYRRPLPTRDRRVSGSARKMNVQTKPTIIAVMNGESQSLVPAQYV